MEELVSIIVPVYNSEKYLKKCIESIINQTYKNLEILLINDGSKDKSKEICIEFNDSRIKFIDKENEGVSTSRNIGLESAEGKYIAFVDSDDYIEKKYIEKLLKVLKAQNADCVICGYNRIYENKTEKITKEKELILNKEEFLKTILNVQNGTGFCWGKLWKAEIIKNIQFDPKVFIGEDALFCMMSCKNINKIYILNEALYNYRFNENSAVRKYDKYFADKVLDSMKIAKKYIEKEYSTNEEIVNKFNNYVAYHILLMAVNFCFNKENGLTNLQQIKNLKKICNIDEFNLAIKKSTYEELSITRKITLFTIKHRLYFITMVIAKVRQTQFKKEQTKKQKEKEC